MIIYIFCVGIVLCSSSPQVTYIFPKILIGITNHAMFGLVAFRMIFTFSSVDKKLIEKDKYPLFYCVQSSVSS